MNCIKFHSVIVLATCAYDSDLVRDNDRADTERLSADRRTLEAINF